jgi:hypothetical protein
MSSSSSDKQRPSFDRPEEAQWHRMIAEAAYYLSQKRQSSGEHCLDDWLAAEQQVRQRISPDLHPEATMNEKIAESPPKTQQNPAPKSDVSRFEKFAATQAAGDGIEGDAQKRDKSIDEKLDANMADRK